ncbi:MAG: hypothetical protein MJZ35_01620 [Bacteroidaceae bacterium]|nr:hypothetical protein [Bacteroidaceae bacterium]
MKKFLGFALLAAFGLGSCTNIDFEEERIKYQEALQAKYNEAFVQEFGQINPNHNWGFGDLVAPNVTRAAVPNANQWGSEFGLDVPAPLTDNQKNTVTAWFTNTKNPTGVAVSWENYFAQQVSSTTYGQNMDELYDAGHGYTDHVFNFNRGDCGPNDNVNNGRDPQYSDKIQYMTGQSTKAFGYHESVGQNTYFDHYVIIPGEMIDPTDALAATGESIKGMYFVGFDYESYKNWAPEEDRVERDFYFNDWIIKITPGLFLPSSNTTRIMCEDLGVIGDFDFNDVVFDVQIKQVVPANQANEWYHSEGTIVLRAAGGTLPLYVNGVEVHEAFGVETNVMVNTGNGATCAPVVLAFEPTSWDANDIEVKVVDGANEYTIDTKRGVAPGKFACPVSVNWSSERVNIKETYPKFSSWVADPNVKFWE